MSALFRSHSDRRADAAGARLRPMTVDWLDAVMPIECAAYDFPWSRGNFIDSLVAGYCAQMLLGPRDELIGYFMAMPGVDELHLLNITVAPAHQGQGHASRLLGALLDEARSLAAEKVWLEVRQGNAHALAVYQHAGFSRVGLRRGYYPAAQGRREDAVVMSLSLPPAAMEDAP